MAWHHIIISIEGEPSSWTDRLASDIQEILKRNNLKAKVEYQGPEGELRYNMVCQERPGPPGYIYGDI